VIGSARSGLGSVRTAGQSGGSGNGSGLDTLAELYLRGLSEDPTVDNLLAGSYFGTYFDTDGSVKIRQSANDDGSGADGNPAITMRRMFSNSAAIGLTADHRTRYTDGTLLSGGTQQKYSIEEADGDSRLFMTAAEILYNGSVLTNYRPTFAMSGGLTTELLSMIGLHQDTVYAVHGRDGNGMIWNRAQLTDTAREMFALVTQMDSEAGGFPVDDSAVSWAVTGPSSSIGLGTQLSRIRTVVDTGNFGSELADTHVDLMAASIAAATVVTFATGYADRLEVPGNLIVGGDIAAGDLLIGNLDVAGDLSVLGDAAVTGRATATGGVVHCAWVSEVIDLTVTGTYDLVPPVGYRFDRGAVAWEIKSTGGTISTSPTYSVGANDATYNDYLAAQTSAGFTTQAAETIVSPGSFVTPTPVRDISANGIKIVVSVAATGTSPVLTARLRMLGTLVPI
jgi:hypothetical protein